MFTRKLWPAHPNILPNELLSSWLMRLSLANGLKLHIFAKLAFPGIEVWNRDIDKSASDELIRLLGMYTGKKEGEVIITTLKSYEGYLYERHTSNTHSKWIMPLGIYHRIRRHYGLVFCPICLREDKTPYFRRHWRLSFSVVCEKHGIRMLDKCPECEAVIAFHRHDFKDRNYITTSRITECYNCRFDLISSPLQIEEDNNLTKFIFSLQWILRCGYIVINKKFIYGHLYFGVLHQLLKLITLDKHGKKLRNVIEDKMHIERTDNNFEEYRLIERLPLQERRHAFRLLSWLLEDWPNNFISACKNANLTKSRIDKDMVTIPYWFDYQISSLKKSTYIPTNAEINSIIQFLKNNNLDINKSIVSKTLGLTDSKIVSDYFNNINHSNILPK